MSRMRILAMIAGTVLVIPGLCSLASLLLFGGMLLQAGIMVIWLSGLALGGLGLYLLFRGGIPGQSR